MKNSSISGKPKNKINKDSVFKSWKLYNSNLKAIGGRRWVF